MYYVYRFLDKANQIVYIGKTGHLKKRMTEHFSKQGHLTEEQYKQIEKIEYVELAFQLDMDILEKYLINLWKPPFNTVDKDSDITLFSFNNAPLKWKDFDKKTVIKPKQSVVFLKEKTQKTKTNHYLAEELKISNELVKILLQSNLTLNEHKLLNAMFTQINPEDTEFKLLTLSSGEIKKLCNFNNSNNLKRDISTNIYNMSNMMFIDNKNKQFSLLTTLKYNNDILSFQFDNYLKPFLLDLKENFIQKQLKEIQEYENEYALRLDMLFTMYFNKKTSKMSVEQIKKYVMRLEFDLEELKTYFFCENKYPRFNSFNERILTPMLNEINNRAFYNVSLEKITENKKVKKLVFFVSLGSRNNKLIVVENKKQTKEKEILIAILEENYNLNKKEIKEIFKNEINKIKQVLKELKNSQITTKEKQKEYILSNLTIRENKISITEEEKERFLREL